MSYSQISDADKRLTAALKAALRLRDDEYAILDEVVDAVKALAEAIADDQTDRTFNRGDYR